jgi:hypothetical protein
MAECLLFGTAQTSRLAIATSRIGPDNGLIRGGCRRAAFFHMPSLRLSNANVRFFTIFATYTSSNPSRG